MKASPYLTFNGNCAEAIALYEKAFEVKAESAQYKEAPSSEGYNPPAGTEDFIMHAEFDIGGSTIMMCDTTPDMTCSFTCGISIHAQFDDMENAKKAFDILKEGGNVVMELQKTFWAESFGSLVDKFGVSWMISLS